MNETSPILAYFAHFAYNFAINFTNPDVQDGFWPTGLIAKTGWNVDEDIDQARLCSYTS